MTGTFSIKRRKQDTPRPSGQNSQGLLTPLLGLMRAPTSPHQGSKPGYTHLSNMQPELRFAAAQEWHAATGRPLPPAMRVRRPLPEPAAMSTRHRAEIYLGAVTSFPALILETLPTQDLLDSPLFTPAQRRRVLHKAGQHGERPAGWTPDRPPPAPRRPRSVAAQRRARRHARDTARHDDRLPQR